MVFIHQRFDSPLVEVAPSSLVSSYGLPECDCAKVTHVVKCQNALVSHLEFSVVIERLLKSDFRIVIFDFLLSGFTASPKIAEH